QNHQFTPVQQLVSLRTGTMLNAEGSTGSIRYAGFVTYGRKFNEILRLVASETELPPVFNGYDYDKFDAGKVSPYQKKQIFENVFTNAKLLKGFLETEIGIAHDRVVALRDFLKSRLRSAIHKAPENEGDVQDVIEILLVGQGMQKGQEYDREVGRVKISAKEAVPDFVLFKRSLALEVKLIKESRRIREVIDEIGADIVSYSKGYGQILFVVYDLGHIRDEAEFCRDLESGMDVSVVVVKH
ncbi:MAG: hypothetical protein OXQ31_11940, partial [Spirochaetaceae bacterium]|nr:hypothetical protein [Spirochaetaceae bacterium]